MIRYLRWIYFGWFALVSAAIILQLYLAGYGAFGFNGLNGYGPHFVVGDLIGIAIFIGIGLAFAARVPWRVTGINGVLAGLMVVQFLLAHAGVQIISALHVINGVLIFVVTLYLTRQAWKEARLVQASPRPQAAPPAAALRTS